MTAPTKGTFAFISLGCPKNTVDSERMLGKLAQEGYTLTADPNGADVVVVNTCGFIEPARQESLGVIREMLALKEEGGVGAVVVAGCLAERKGEELLREVPDVDHIMGVFAREEIVAVLDRTLAQRNADEQRAVFRPAPVKAMEDTARLRVTPRHYAYLKISEGCDRLCTFCAIPMMRGKHLTKPMEEVIREARELAADGVRELIIVGQDTTYYGKDLYGKTRLAELLRELDQIPGIEWIRVLYAYPMYIDDELLHTFASARKIVPYIDMPLQHGSDRMLRRMARRVDRAGTEALLGRMRELIPNLALRTTFIVGFPGETDTEFQELCDFVQNQCFERAGVFPYSFEPGTPAARLDGHLPEEVKQERRDHLMEIQQAIALDWARKKVGAEVEVIIDGADPEVPGHYIARTVWDAPDIDCFLRLKGKKLAAGDIVRTKITGADDYDLLGRALSVR
jgi:ribosomal protein S12 methylthiotransferase